MFDFDQSHSFPTARVMALAPTAMVATSHPLAVQAGLQMLHHGGNAVDAALAAAAVLTVVEPMSTSLGGDAFAIIYDASQRRVFALNASGRSSKFISLELLAQRGLHNIPEDSGLSVNTPGVVDGWAECSSRHGRLGLDTVLGPAIDYAEKGFLVTPVVGRLWAHHVDRLSRHQESARVFLPHGRAPKVGEFFTNADLGRTLRSLAARGPREFYEGDLAEALVREIGQAGGVLSAEDLQEHRSDWVEPLSVNYRGLQVLEMPPNTQGIAVLSALNLMSSEGISSYRHNSADYLHFLIESTKLVFADAARHVADPAHLDIPVGELLDAGYARRRYQCIRPRRAQVMEPGLPADGADTVYVAAVDGEGNAVSLINSIFRHFGSVITVPGTGVLLQNRAIGFSYDLAHPNCLAPRKRCFHTLIPAMVLQNEKPWAVLGVVGAAMQPQGHIQLLANLVDFHMSPQAALDAPRYRFLHGLEVALEAGIPDLVRKELERYDHRIYPGNYPDGFGGGQIILVSDHGRCGGSDARKDGCASGY